MSTTTQQKNILKGGEWLIKESSPFDTFIPEDFSEEQQMVKDMCASFLEAEVLPILERIDKMEPGLMPSLVTKAGEQGLLGASIPEQYGGLGKDFITSNLVGEGLGGGFSRAWYGRGARRGFQSRRRAGAFVVHRPALLLRAGRER